MQGIIVIAGTADARQAVQELSKLDIEIHATVTTTFGLELLEGHGRTKIHQGKLTAEEMAQLIKETHAVCLIDASHPFAREASINAISACKNTGIPYLRFEREELEYSSDNIIRVKSFEEAAEKAAQFKGNILLTTGSNNLDVFINRISDFKDRLFARVLPESKVIEKCEESGLTARNIIALKGPFSEEMNIEMIKHCKADLMITKESGNAGGTLEKITAAEKLGIQVIIVNRPNVDYTEKVSSIGDVAEFVKTRMGGQ